MTHLLLLCQYYTLPSFFSHKERGAAVSKGVHSCHFSNANREPRNTSLPLFDVNNRNAHSFTLTQMGTQPCFSYYSTTCTGGIFFILTHICFLSVHAGYLGWLRLITPLTEQRSNLRRESGSLEEAMHSRDPFSHSTEIAVYISCISLTNKMSSPFKKKETLIKASAQSTVLLLEHFSRVARWSYQVTNLHHKLLLIFYNLQPFEIKLHISLL